MGLSSGRKIPPTFYQGDDVVSLAKQLLGCTIHTSLNDQYCVAKITETEAYNGQNDAACHAHKGRRSARTEVMYHPGGLAYVYLCYGIHHLFNIVTNEEEKADAVLIRAAQPLLGVEHMLKRRNQQKFTEKLLAGPGNFSKGMGIHTQHYGYQLQGPEIWLEFPSETLSEQEIRQTTRIGVDYAGEDRLLPWRFYSLNHGFISKK